MVFQGSQLFFHGSKSVFMVSQFARLFFMVPGKVFHGFRCFCFVVVFLWFQVWFSRFQVDFCRN